MALATTISQYVSAFLIITSLMHMEGSIHFSFRRLKINKAELVRAVSIGLPSAVQTSMFSVSNVLIQSAVNTFGSTVMAAWAATDNVDGFMVIIGSSIAQATTAYVGQNVGAGNYGRVKKIIAASIKMSVGTMVFMSILGYILRNSIFELYATNPEVVSLCTQIFAIYCMGYFILAIQQVLVGTIQGTGYTILSMLASVFGAVVLRITWVYVICAKYHSILMLALGYPVSWLAVLLLQCIGCVIAMRRVKRDIELKIQTADAL